MSPRLRIPPRRLAAAAECSRIPTGRSLVKGSQKPKKLGKKPAQRTLKERRAQKRDAARQSRPLDV
jgi:hypothetical protein